MIGMLAIIYTHHHDSALVTPLPMMRMMIQVVDAFLAQDRFRLRWQS